MVEYYIGKRSRFAFGKEASYGEAPGDSAWSYTIVDSISPTSKSEMEGINVLDSTITRNVSGYFEHLRTYGATVTGLIQHFGFCSVAWGTDSYGGGTHTIGEGDDIPSFSMNYGSEHGTTDHIVEITGNKVNTLKLSCDKKDFLKFDAEIMGQTAASDPSWREHYTSVDKKYYSINDLPPYHYSGCVVTLGGVSYCETEKIDININNNLFGEPTLCAANGKRINEPVPQIREYTAEVTLRMRNTALYDLWETGEAISGANTITFTSGARVLTFTLHGAYLESAIAPLKLSEGVVMVTLPFKCEQILVTEDNSINTSY